MDAVVALTVMSILLLVLAVCRLIECEGARVMSGMKGGGVDEVRFG